MLHELSLGATPIRFSNEFLERAATLARLIARPFLIHSLIVPEELGHCGSEGFPDKLVSLLRKVQSIHGPQFAGPIKGCYGKGKIGHVVLGLCPFLELLVDLGGQSRGRFRPFLIGTGGNPQGDRLADVATSRIEGQSMNGLEGFHNGLAAPVGGTGKVVGSRQNNQQIHGRCILGSSRCGSSCILWNGWL